MSTPIFKPGQITAITAFSSFLIPDNRSDEQKKADAEAYAKWEAEYRARKLANILSGAYAAAEAERVERERKTNEILAKLSEEEQELLSDYFYNG